MSKLGRVVAAGLAVASLVLGAAASARTRKYAPMVFVTLLATLLALSCAPEQPPEPPSGEVIVAAGDIAACNSEGDEATARLVGGIEGTVLTLGDNAYPDGSAQNFGECYEPTWGQFKERTRPTPGNHEYKTDEGASAYFEYFGKAAGDPDEGYYSYELGSWHIVALNSNCGEGEIRCGPDSAQVQWLKEDLAANADEERCTLAYMHHPRFSSGEEHGSTPKLEPLWEALYAGGADVVLSGHEHNYERFSPQEPNGKADPQRGIREFVVGTGGKKHYPILEPIANSEVHNDETYGVLKLTLNPKSYEWSFVPVEGETFSDSGGAQCH
jgi:acid phosphatase type 7